MQSISKEEILAQRFYNQGLIKLKKMAALLLVCISALVVGNLVAWISKELSLSLIYKQVTIFLYLGYIVFVLSLSFIFDKAGLSSQLTKEEFERQDMRKIKRFSL